MRIGIDLFSFDKPGNNYGVGPGVYVWRLLPFLFDLGNEHEFIVFANHENVNLVPRRNNVSVVVSPLPSRFRPLRILHEQIYLPLQFWRRKLEIVHFLGNNISYLLGSRSILTVYDLMWKYYSDSRGSRNLKYKYFAITVPLSIKKARVLITISKHVANQIEEFFGVPHERTFPILLASGGLSHPQAMLAEELHRKYAFPFLFTVTTSMPHKNLHTLLEAFLKLRVEGSFAGKLVIAGQLKGDFKEATLAFIEKHNMRNNILLCGFISEEEKTYCYEHAALFVYPSLYEGFGLPVLEAMEAGVPVIASNRASIPEVGGDACLYFNPESVDELASVIKRCFTNVELSNELRQRGVQRVKRFSWEQTAQETLRVYQEAMQ